MTGPKKGLSIGAAMKQRMNSQEEQADVLAQVAPSVPAPVQETPSAPEETDPLESFNTRLPRSLLRRLKVHAAQEGAKIQDVLREALENHLDRQA